VIKLRTLKNSPEAINRHTLSTPTTMQSARSFSTSAVSSASANAIRSSLVLSRIPIVTKDVPEFEKLFYNYQEQLERRLMWTFPKWYYFKKGTVAEREFREAQINPIPYYKGVWYPNGQPDLKHSRDRRFKQDVILPKKHREHEEGAALGEDGLPLPDLDDVGRPIKPNSRITKADETNDQSSLERKLPRTLYLLIQDKKGEWKFPTFEVSEQDHSKGLHQVAEDGLRTLGGDKINTWSVSNTPAALIKYDTKGKIISDESAPVNEFLVKSHIVAGKFDLDAASSTDADVKAFKWLAKEELAELLNKEYYAKISHILSQ
jgi:large subunit ribosomal protein L46